MIAVKLLDHMGSDLSVVNAARVSFAKEKLKFDDKDKRLLAFLAEHQHWEPFAHPQVSFRFKAPIFVARQLQKHRVGFAWNEISRRYIDQEPEFYVPSEWRERAENVKQGSSNHKVDLSRLDTMRTSHHQPISHPEALFKEAIETYNSLLELNVCPEQARMVLPQAMMTEWIWTGSLLGWSRVYNLRSDSHAQKETQIIANLIDTNIKPLFPNSWSALTNG